MQQNYLAYFSLDILCHKSKIKQSLKTKLNPQLCVFLITKTSAQNLQSTFAMVIHNSLYNDFSLSHFTSLKCPKKSILLHQVRACNQFVQPTMF